MKGIHFSLEEYCTNKMNEAWDRKLLQQEPNPIDNLAYEKNFFFIG